MSVCAHSYTSLCIHVYVHWLFVFVTPQTRTVGHQVPLSMGLPGKNPGVGCHFLLQGIFPTPGIEPRSPRSPASDSLQTEPPGKPTLGTSPDAILTRPDVTSAQ